MRRGRPGRLPKTLAQLMALLRNETSPVQRLRGFVPEPNGRGTLGILWSCLAVLFLNTWTVLHINIPPQDQKTPRRWLHRLKCWAIGVTVSDAITATAFSQWRCARRSVKELRSTLPWWKLVHGFYAEMGGFKVEDDEDGQQYTFRAAQLAWLHKEKIITLPEISEQEIKDKSKANGIAKGLACAQSTWFVLQSIARISQHLPLTTLEIEVVAFVGATWLIYLFWWKKPFDVETCTIIHVQRILPRHLRRLAVETCSPEKEPSWWRPVVKEVHPRGWDFYWFEKPWKMTSFEPISASHLLPIYLSKIVERTSAEPKVADWYRPAVNESHPSEWEFSDDAVIYGVGIFFNGIQLAAWNFTFPTPTEGLLWKISVLVMLASITVWVPTALALSWLPPASLAKQMPLYLLATVYGVSRVYVVVEIFAGLRALPPDVFQTVNWSAYIPHLF